MQRHQINYHKRKNIDLSEFTVDDANIDSCNKYNPFDITNLQQYNPVYSVFFQLKNNNYNSISLNHEKHIHKMDQVFNSKSNAIEKKEIFIKFSPLLDPIRYMIGKYSRYGDAIRTLPCPENDNSHVKLKHYHNASYVDNFFYYLSSILLNNHHFIHGVDYYGSFLGIQKSFKINIDDDLSYLQSSAFFKKNIGRLYHLTETANEDQAQTQSQTQGQYRINHDDDAIILEHDVLGDIEDNVITSNTKSKSKSKSDMDSDMDSGAGSGSGSDSGSDSDSDSDSHSHSDSDSDSDSDHSHSSSEWSDTDSETENFAYINDFPVQMICLEKCENTLDSLFKNDEMTDECGLSALFQIIMILLTYQKAFDLTHNDLHTNNVMYVRTTVPYLFYKYKNVHYKVPTFGKIYKIIDFGRAIYKYKSIQFCSDSFARNGDGSTQYNCEPFFDKQKRRIQPNYSFDLSRLASSIYDFIIPEDADLFSLTSMQDIINEWTSDDNGVNILYKENGKERYPGFQLYKMIARTVHRHTPENQLKNKYFRQYEIGALVTADVIDIDMIPSYRV
jgi:hypothetical protein